MVPAENCDFSIEFPKDLNDNQTVIRKSWNKIHTVDEALSVLGFGRTQCLMILMGAILLFGINNETMG